MGKSKKTSGGSHADALQRKETGQVAIPSEDVAPSNVPLSLQQHVLNIFRDACAAPLGDNIQPTIQEVKQHLYNRDFATAFAQDEYLWAYAARWSPSRALAYLQIFDDISEHVTKGPHRGPRQHPALDESPDKVPAGPAKPLPSSIDVEVGKLTLSLPPSYDADMDVPPYEAPPAYGSNMDPAPTDSLTPANYRIASLGGGAGAELVAAAAWLRLQSETSESGDGYTGQAAVDANSLEVCCVDVAAWDKVITQLETAIKSPLTISKYASAALKASNLAMLPADAMIAEAIQRDLLDTDLDVLRSTCIRSDLITCMFTLNELYSTSVSKTQRLLFEITVSTAPGTLLLVVDSPGSYSTVTLNGAEKKYPMHWLLDHTLLAASKNTRILPRANHWQKVMTDESRWFRLPKGLVYPIELENMRYQIHLYRRLGVSGEPQASTSRRPG